MTEHGKRSHKTKAALTKFKGTLWLKWLAALCVLDSVGARQTAAQRVAAVRGELARLERRGWVTRLQITQAQLECAASQVQSQNLEDLRILEMLLLAARHEGNRTYVELGAYDGKKFSNTWVLERCFGWHGLLIEGSPENFLKLRNNRGLFDIDAPNDDQCGLFDVGAPSDDQGKPFAQVQSPLHQAAPAQPPESVMGHSAHVGARCPPHSTSASTRSRTISGQVMAIVNRDMAESVIQ